MMPKQPDLSMPRILILYSSPDDEARLRIDREDRAIVEVMQRLQIEPSVLRRCHAARLADLTKALAEGEWDVVQFSGHGDRHGLYLESHDDSGGVLVTAAKLARILKQGASRLKAAMFLSCFSSDVADALGEVSPFLITVSGPADDAGCIEFVSGFYEGLFRTGSVEQAFRAGLMRLDVADRKDGVKPLLSRRSATLPGRKIIQTYPNPKFDSILVDITDAEPDIDVIGVERDYLLFLLTRKLGIHRWIFGEARQRAFISIGPYFGLFSWADADDLIRCHQIMRLLPDVDDETCEEWAFLLTAYNDVWSTSYRTDPVPNPQTVRRGHAELQFIYRTFFEGKGGASLRKAAPEHFKVARASLSANLNLADYKLHADDLDGAVRYLEVAVSSVHDLVDILASRLLVPGRSISKAE
ncbi:MAG TPA: hypothetical protein VKB79_27010 [Bryobacteraceae bacterium]|nr:hypothetical protein [Bryobacteraceae bacterium]